MFSKQQPQPQVPPVGETRKFVLSSGFTTVRSYDALIGDDQTKRLFAELTADMDRPDVRPHEAYQEMLGSLQPGWTIRLMQIFWPDPGPREVFFEHASSWPEQELEGLKILREGFLLFVQQSGHPYTRRTILEFVLPGEEGISWWDSLPDLCLTYGVTVTRLSKAEIQNLVYWTFNPVLE